MKHCFDASVAVKWFKDGEIFEEEASELFRRIKDLELEAVGNEWILLEVVRALVKVGYSKEKIDEAFEVLSNLFTMGIITRIPVSTTLPLAKNLEVDLSLYAADTVHLATAIVSGASILWTEDKHLHKKGVKKRVSKHELRICSLAEVSEK